MAEDWRVTGSLGVDSARGLGAAISEHELEEEARASLGGRVAISADSSNVYLYASTRAAAVEAQRVVASILEQAGGTASFSLDRWHPLEQAWEPADVPLPGTEAERRRERERLEAQDAADTTATGHAAWEVRLDLPSHGDAVDLAARLESAGLGVTRRWTYVLVGAGTEDEARALAKRLRDEAPPGSTIQAQAGGEMVWESWQKRPFAWLGDIVA